jgi:hypothetical protein
VLAEMLHPGSFPGRNEGSAYVPWPG